MGFVSNTDAKDYLFRSSTLERGSVDKDNGIIRGVSVIEAGLIAEGHGLLVDEKAIRQFHAAALKDSRGRKRESVPVKVNHKSGLSELAGRLINFRIEGPKLRADLYLLQANKDYDLILEAAEEQPGTFGLSTAFRGVPEVIGGQPCARCEMLKAVDIVVDPAANSEGLFSAQVDKGFIQKESESMHTDLDQIRGLLEQQGAQLQEFSARLDGVDYQFAEFSDAIEDAAIDIEEMYDDVEDDDLEENPNVLSDAINPDGTVDLSGFSDDEIEALVEGGVIEIEEFSADSDGLDSLRDQVSALTNYIMGMEEEAIAEHEEVMFSTLQDKITGLAESHATLLAENEALRQCVTGTGMNVAFDTDRDCYTLTESQGVASTEFDSLVDVRMEADGGKQPRSHYFSEMVEARPDWYAEYRETIMAGRYGTN